MQQPVSSGSFSTTQRAIAVSGAATDNGNNLSRVKVLNTKTGLEFWDYSLSGSSHGFLVGDVGLLPGANTVQVTAFDDANNASATTALSVEFLTEVQGAVIIVAGHNEDFVLQSNIDYSANRAYRIFRGAGFAKDQIRYLAASPQDPDSDGVSEVFADATTTNIQDAIQNWAAARVDTNKPLYLYMMDHGMIENFCADGCAAGAAGSQALDSWLTALENATGVDEVNVVIEACHSGSFIDRAVDVAKSISKTNRVVITSTDRDHNAYASAQGAYFSDNFFTCISTSKDLRTCFEQARAAVMVNPNGQAPWMDDNGDSVFNASDGSVAQTRYMAKFFGASAPAIAAASVTVNGANGTLTADVEQGGAKIEMVWAVIYPPSFVPPAGTTLDLGVPMKKLDPDSNVAGRYVAAYPNGFSEAGEYKVVFYARDKADAFAAPKLVVPGAGPVGKKVYLPMLRR